MARSFDDTDDQRLQYAGTIVSVPFTMACWARLRNVTDYHVLMAIDGPWSSRHFLEAAGGASGDPCRAQSYDGTEANALSTTGFSAETWHHFCGVWAANNDRRAYIDGGSRGNDTTSISPSPDNTTIGAYKRSTSFYNETDGDIAECAIWNAALTDAEVTILALGYSPLFVRPQSLVAYWPLIRDEDQDRVGGYDLTAYNSPTIAAHPPIIYPARFWSLVPSTGGGTLYQKPLAGTLTSAGSLNKHGSKPLDGTLTSDGALSKQVSRSLAGTLTGVGTIAKQASTFLAGALTGAGSIVKQASKSMTGVLTSSGGVSVSMAYLLSLAGTLTSSGTIGKEAHKIMVGGLVLSGSLSRFLAKIIQGTLTPTGRITRRIAKTIVGALTLAGELAAAIVQALSPKTASVAVRLSPSGVASTRLASAAMASARLSPVAVAVTNISPAATIVARLSPTAEVSL